jgi:hypothetical protein
VVESVDGLATLSLPAGSLPEGVSPDDVQLSVLVDEAAEPGAPVLAVQLLPHGLVLEEPATLTAALPAALDGGFMVIHRSGDTIEFLDGQVELADDGPMFVTSISHFSELYFSAFDKAFEISVSLTPTEVAEGQTQPAEITMAEKPEPIDARVDFFTDPDRTSRRVRFSAPIPPFQFDRPTIRWGFSWDPIEVPVELSKAATGWEAQASSKCEVPNETKVRFWSSVSFTVELLELGEPESEDLFGFSHFLTSAAGEGASCPVRMQRRWCYFGYRPRAGTDPIP